MEDQLTPGQDALKPKDAAHPDFCATSSTPNVKGDRNAASSMDNFGTEEEYYDGDDIDEFIYSGESSESESVSDTNSRLDFGKNSTSSDSNDSPDMSGSRVQKPRAASRSLKGRKVVLSSSEPDSDDDSRFKKSSRRPKKASFAVKSYCYFCSVGYVKMARHLQKHVDEDPDLAKAFSLPPKSKERKRILTIFRTRGNYQHNQEVMKHNQGDLKLKRRPKNNVSVSFHHCPYCKGLYAHDSLWKHASECTSRETLNSSTETPLANSTLTQNVPPAVQKLLSDMKQDRVRNAVQRDALLLKLAEHLSDKAPEKPESVIARLREMGKLLITLQGKAVPSFQEAIQPANFCTLVKHVHKMAGYCVKTKSYTKPSLALKLGHSLKKIGVIVLEQDNNNEQKTKDASAFIKLCDVELSLLVSQMKNAKLRGHKPKKLSTVQFICDVQLFYRYLESASASAVTKLQSAAGQEVYAALCRVTLAKVSVLNKRAPEVSKMTLKAFQEREDAAQVLSRHFLRIKIENTDNQTITVLLTSDLISAITLLMSKRNECGVHKDNPFLFARPNSSPTSIFHVRKSIRAFSLLCHAKHPEHLHSVRCHRYIARVFQILMLENDELEHLAKMLGHNFRADRDYYQLPKAAVDLAKIVKLIVAMEKGCLEKYQEKSLEEVEIEDELELDEEQRNHGDSDAEEDDLQERDSVKEKATPEKPRLRKREEKQTTPREDMPEAGHSEGWSSSADGCDEDYTPEKAGDHSEDTDIPDRGASSDESNPSRSNSASLKKKSFYKKTSDEDESESSSDEEYRAQQRRSINYCFVCGKAQTKVSRHLYTHRHDNPEIAEMFKLRKNSKARFQRLGELRERGNSIHNEKVLQTGCGELKVKRKPGLSRPLTKACLFCQNMFASQEIKKHVSKCPVRKSKEPLSCKTGVLSVVASAQLNENQETASEVSSMIKSMKQKEISAALLNDPYLLLMAQYFLLMSGSESVKKEKILFRLRAIGKLLLQLKKTSVSSLEDVMKPENFGKVVEGVKELSDFNQERKSYGKPNLMHTIGLTLKSIADLSYARALREEDNKQRIDDVQAFMRLCLNEWGGFYKSRSAVTVPFIQDAQILFHNMEKTFESALESLTKYESAQVYCALSRVMTAHLMLLNQNEDVFELSLKSFQEREEAEAAVSQSQIEQILSAQLIKVSVKNNKGKQIIMTLTPAFLAALELLVSKREACNVNSNNLYLFAQPGAQCTKPFKGNRCFNLILSRCNAEDKVTVKSLSLRKYLTRVFQILSLSNEQLDQLSKLLGREIQIDREYYQKSEAAQDIARLMELLSAAETETLERFEGKSFQEIEFAGELEPHLEPINPENSDAEGENEESESSFQKKRSAKKSTARKKSSGKSSSKSSSKRPDRGREKRREGGRRMESEDEASELDDQNKEVNTEQDDQSEERPKSLDGTSACENKASSNMFYSDNDDDMNVDFDSDEDIPNNEGNKGDDETQDSAEMRPLPSEKIVTETSCDSTKKACAADKTDMESEDNMEEDDEGEEEQSDVKDEDSQSPSPLSDEENRKKILATVMKKSQARIVIPKLDLDKLKAPILLSQMSPAVISVEKDQPVHAEDKHSQKSSISSDAINKPSNEKEFQMICCHCKKIMLKGQTAFQKKGFTDVFCSKNCLFQKFPVNKPVTRPCFHCARGITNISDLIMAAVDVKGTMKDFCSVMCLCSFKSTTGPSSTQQLVCSMCKKKGTTTCGMMLKGVFYKFCSENCFEAFRRDNLRVCAKCNSTCYKPLKLKLQEETKSLCSQDCLDGYTKEIKQHHPCTMCHIHRPVSDMITDNVGEDMIELFCAQGCVTSYKLRPTYHKEMEEPGHLRSENKDKQTAEEEIRNASHSTVNKNDSETRNAPIVTIGTQTYCSICGKCVPSGKKVCPLFCVVANNKHRRCFSCNEVISRPHSIIRVPVDDKGTMGELCSNKCLTSINSKRSLSRCKMCNSSCFSSGRLTLDDHRHTVCSDACFISYHKANNLPFVTCDICSFNSEKQLTLKIDDGDKLVCSDKCLVKMKESIKKPQLCPMCQISHQISDMVEDENDEGELVFFCSNRCMMVHRAQSLTISERTDSVVSKEEDDEEDIKVQIIQNMGLIKQEPIEEEYKQDPLSFLSAENIKDEPNVAKDDLKTEEAPSFSSSGVSTSTEPAAVDVDESLSCFNCKKALTDEGTAYQKKNHSEMFCSSTCLLNFFQMQDDRTSCTFCLQTITRKTRTVLQAPVDDEGTMKDFCGQTCLFSFNYKRMMTTKVSIVPVASHSQCSMCNRYCISKHEIIKDTVVHKVCSDPCFNRFCNLNELSICVNCYSNFQTPLTVSMEDCCKHMCSTECLAQYKQKVKTPQPCTMCSTSLQMSEMVESKNSEGEVELFCSNDCVVASRIQTVCSSGAQVKCDNCGKTAAPACHFTMSDTSIRSFCSQSCAMDFKGANKNKTVSTGEVEAPDKTDSLEPPKQLCCDQCHRIMKTPPKVIEEKDRVSFACSPSCSEEFMRCNNIFGKCEHCEKENIVKIVKRVKKKDCEKDCFFCSDECKMLFHQGLKKQWGKYCQSCAYCLSISQKLVTARNRSTVNTFCSNNCKLRYSLLIKNLSKCDTCGFQRSLTQSLSLIGEVKYFCDTACTQQFCTKLQMKVSSGQSVSTSEPSPVIANVISLAGALDKHKSSTSSGLKTQISYSPLYFQTKVVGHASVQTVPKELKNKSLLCTPLVHNKGVSCVAQTVDTEVQTEKFEPVVLPVPVPVYVPLPLNMYSQFTPQPLGLPVPVPVPVFLPGKPNSLDEAVKPVQKEMKLDSVTEKEDLRSQTETVQHEKNKQTDRAAMEKGQQEVLIPTEHSSNTTDETVPDRQTDVKNQEETCVNPYAGSPEKASSVSGTVVSCKRQCEHQSLPSSLETKKDQQISAPAPSSQTQPAEKVRNKNKGHKLQSSSSEVTEETRHRGFYKTVLKGHGRVESQCGVDAWRRWIHWRRTLKYAVIPQEEILLCSATELSDSLCVFVQELQNLDRETPPDQLFYLCLCIQQYLFENGRMENIFSDSVYIKFSSEFTKILRGFKPTVTAGSYINFYVEEEFLWQCKQLGAYSPIVLLNTMLFFCCKSLGFTTVQQHRQLSFTHIVRRTKTNSDYSKSRFLLFYLPKSITEAESVAFSDEDGVPPQKRKKTDSVAMMTENAVNPLRCPVRLYEFYLSKCSEPVRRHPNLFYLQPDRNCVPSSPVWFSCSPLDDSVMEAMLVRILATREMWGYDEGGSGESWRENIYT